MPCSDSNYHINGECYPDCEARQRLDMVTDILCRLVKQISTAGLDEDIQQWIKDHQEWDKRRTSGGDK